MPAKKQNPNAGGSKSAVYYQTHPEAAAKKKEYDTQYHATPERRAYRGTLNRLNRLAGTYGNNDGKDVSHTSVSSKFVLEKASANRARNGSDGSSTKLPANKTGGKQVVPTKKGK